jgi:hypothetical protein
MDIGLPQDFKDFLRLLDADGVEYLLIGACAVADRGYPRATEDIDHWIASHPENARRMVAAPHRTRDPREPHSLRSWDRRTQPARRRNVKVSLPGRLS